VIFFGDTTQYRTVGRAACGNLNLRSQHGEKRLDIEPRVAMLSFSGFGSVHHPRSIKVAKATQI
jgi:malate dehydrogenase (oxaloacetate-decarboxylating)(NADP+)